MLQNTKELYGHNFTARDGDIGSVKDFFFDDKRWVIRYMVADTGSWISGRLVLLSPHAFGSLDRNKKTLSVNLTRKQIESSPAIDSRRPVSRQYEIDYYEYYGWPAYWTGGALWGLGGSPLEVPIPQDLLEAKEQQHHRDDKHLRSAREATGYAIHATDGQIGAVSGLMVDDTSWAIEQISVEAGHWFSGKEILVPTTRVLRISYEDSAVFVDLTKAGIQHTAAHEVVKAVA